MPDVGPCAMAAVHPEKSAIIQGIVLLEMDAVFAGLVFHIDHLIISLTYFRLKVNNLFQVKIQYI